MAAATSQSDTSRREHRRRLTAPWRWGDLGRRGHTFLACPAGFFGPTSVNRSEDRGRESDVAIMGDPPSSDIRVSWERPRPVD
jgi:hypothetical protein